MKGVLNYKGDRFVPTVNSPNERTGYLKPTVSSSMKKKPPSRKPTRGPVTRNSNLKNIRAGLDGNVGPAPATPASNTVLDREGRPRFQIFDEAAARPGIKQKNKPLSPYFGRGIRGGIKKRKTKKRRKQKKRKRKTKKRRKRRRKRKTKKRR